MKIVTLIAILIVSAGGSAQSTSECVPKLKDCEKPVKWIADKQDCSCYACEYGKPTQHTGCTQDQQLKAELKLLQKEVEYVAQSPLLNLRGTIKIDGDKYTLVSDKDDKSWDIMNPEALKGHEGHHVQISAHVYADKNTIHIMSVKMMKSGKPD